MSSTDTIPVPPGFNIASITAPLLFGGLFDYLFYGVLITQVYVYRVSFPKDKISMQALVYGIVLFETIQTAMCTADMYYWFLSGFGNMKHLSNPYLSPFDTPTMSSLISLAVQSWFCYRIWVLNHKYIWLLVVIIPISIAQAVGAINGAVFAHRVGDFAAAQSRVYNIHLWLIGNAVADVLIAAAMTHLLLRARHADNQYTSSILTRIVRLTVETNALTAGFALFGLIIFKAVPGTNWFTAPTLIIGKLYSNTLLLTFNNRILLKNAAISKQSAATGTTIFSVSDNRHSARNVPLSPIKATSFGEVNTLSLNGNLNSPNFSITKTEEIV
ncbi:hypothetical protein HGRIS_006927 [Hohenbuehelia grisea]|uniref:DUF6534 domain-containing protein n=1 Tax=Hohenbuehelia grisea TaxID=104357 RepID=A0ABR3JB80_9AGAR